MVLPCAINPSPALFYQEEGQAGVNDLRFNR